MQLATVQYKLVRLVFCFCCTSLQDRCTCSVYTAPGLYKLYIYCTVHTCIGVSYIAYRHNIQMVAVYTDTETVSSVLCTYCVWLSRGNRLSVQCVIYTTTSFLFSWCIILGTQSVHLPWTVHVAIVCFCGLSSFEGALTSVCVCGESVSHLSTFV